MRGLLYLLCVLAALALIVGVLLTAVDICAFDVAWYEREYQKLGVSKTVNMKFDDLMDTTERLLEYTRGKLDTLSFKTTVAGKSRTAFNEREQNHMVDVQRLAVSALTLRTVALAAAALVLVACTLAARRERLRMLSKSYVIGMCVFGACMLAIGAWVLVDFESFWIQFHLLFFTNDLWQLDPATSLMINMFPQTFFFDLCLRILGIFAAVAGGLLALSIGYLIYRALRQRAPLAVRGK